MSARKKRARVSAQRSVSAHPDHRDVSPRSLVIAAVALSALTLAAYSPSLQNGFVSLDDTNYVTENLAVQGGLSVQGIRYALTSFDCANWHPLTWLSLMLDHQLHGLNPSGYHMTNLILHLANTLLLLLALALMTGSIGRSTFVAGLFALHPLHVESVAWVAERKDVLSAFFWMLTLLAYWHYTRRPGVRRYVLVMLSLTLGLMSKPMLVTLPFVLLLLDYWPLGRMEERRKGGKEEGKTRGRGDAATPGLELPRPCYEVATGEGRGEGKVCGARFRHLIIEKLPLLALSAGSCVVTIVAQTRGGGTVPLGDLPFTTRLSNAVLAYVMYMWKAVWPTGLSCFYPPFRNVPLLAILGAGLLLMVLTPAVVAYGRRWRYLAVGWLWYVITLLPVIGLVQVGSQAMADRYTYIPLIGVFVAAAWGVPDLVVYLGTRGGRGDGASGRPEPKNGKKDECKKGREEAPSTPSGRVREAVSRGGERESNVEHPTSNVEPGHLQPSTPRITSLLAAFILLVLAALTYVQVGIWKDDDTLCGHAIRVNPANYVAHNTLGTSLARRAEFDRALRHYQAALKASPGYAQAHNNMANVLVQQGRLDEAVEHYREAIRSYPGYVQAYNNLGLALERLGKTEEAISQLRRASDLSPGLAGIHNNLGDILARHGMLEQGIAEFKKALAIAPNHAQARINLAIALYTERDYRAAWEQVWILRDHGIEPPRKLVDALSRAMPDPGQRR